MSIVIAVDSQGHLILPEPLREKIGVSGGGAVVAEETPDGILLRKRTEFYSPERVQEFEEMNEKALEPKRPFLERFTLE
jgi:bifunctional DNA-binding transcriptional regulator/antitoxin component of YhaV-PrlF toxin-antitoxin module